MDLLEAWAAWARPQPREPPFVLDQDRGQLASAPRTTIWPSWEAAHTDLEFEALGDKSLHLGLLPFPFSGDLRRATVYLLTLNPGVVPTDYYGEWNVGEFRDARFANLRQDFGDGQCPFLGLDPRFAWHAGFDYWHRQVGLRTVIADLARDWGVNFAEARRRLARALAVVEVFPYHSADQDAAKPWLAKLPSFELARRFVHEKVLPRVRDGEPIVIVHRQVKSWGLPTDLPGVFTNPPRGASLNPNSRCEIRKHLG